MQDFDNLLMDVKEIKSDVKDISQTLLRNTVSLEYHSARTAINEDRIRQVEHWLLGFLASIVLSTVYYFLRH